VSFGVIGGVSLGVSLGVSFGVIAGVSLGGGDAVIQHLLLRLTLRYYGHGPMNYADFLTYCTNDLHILRRVGGAFVFRHRTLLEYFAAQYRAEDFG
jgi:hypothetical protein